MSTKTNCLGRRLYVSNEDAFQNNSGIARNSLKKRMLQLGIPYVCDCCRLNNIWNSRLLVLHLDHINGINNDNRLENLRFLCPNCHSQTPTYAGRGIPKKANTLTQRKCLCGAFSRYGRCKTCFAKEHPQFTKITWPTPEEITQLIWKMPATKLADKLGVSDKALEKFCHKHNISKPPRGYWTKKMNGVTGRT